LVTQCKENEIQSFLKARASAFANLRVMNFDLLPVQITAEITIKNGYEFQGVQKSIVQGLDLFLSPWITSDSLQIAIDQGLSDVQVVAFIKTIEGVLEVGQVTFNVQTTGLPPGTLLVSGMDHHISLMA
jgi:hypothetical protein